MAIPSWQKEDTMKVNCGVTYFKKTLPSLVKTNISQRCSINVIKYSVKPAIHDNDRDKYANISMFNIKLTLKNNAFVLRSPELKTLVK